MFAKCGNFTHLIFLALLAGCSVEEKPPVNIPARIEAITQRLSEQRKADKARWAAEDADREAANRTWVDKIAPVTSIELKGEGIGRQTSNIDPPLGWEHVDDGEARVVTDRVTGEQVLVINRSWRDGDRTMYRVLRQARTTVHEYLGDEKGWAEVTDMHGHFWSVEERSVDELAPIPEA